MYPPQEVVRSLKLKVTDVKKKGEIIDYLTFVPDGEPTLDINLGEEIDLLRELGIKIAVISNSSLIWKKDVQEDLAKADLISLKIDAVTEKTWKRINRPERSLKLDRILSGIAEFSQEHNGSLLTETMLIKGINDSKEEIEMLGDFIAGLHPEKSFITSPVRPPAENWVKKPSENSLNYAYQHFKNKSIPVEILTGHEEPHFVSTGDLERDLLNITTVHPMREESLEEFLSNGNKSWDLVKKLINEGKLVEVGYRGDKFYIRRL